MISKLEINEVIYQKKDIRKYIKHIRSAINKESCFERSYAIYDTLKSIINFDKIKVISCYLDFNNEVNTGLFILYCLENKIKISLPKVDGEKILFKDIENINDSLIENSYGILEPSDNATTCDIKDIDIFVAPALLCSTKKPHNYSSTCCHFRNLFINTWKGSSGR